MIVTLMKWLIYLNFMFDVDARLTWSSNVWNLAMVVVS